MADRNWRRYIHPMLHPAPKKNASARNASIKRTALLVLLRWSIRLNARERITVLAITQFIAGVYAEKPRGIFKMPLSTTFND